MPILRPHGQKAATKTHGSARIDRLHEYRDEGGRLLGYIVRTPAAPERGLKKACMPVVLARGVQLADGTVADGWTFSAMPTPRVPFGVHQLAKAREAAVVAGGRPLCLLVEGEKCQEDATAALPTEGVVVVSWVGGADKWDSTDWTHLMGWDVVAWPDNDEQGRAAMRGILTALAAAGTGGALRWIEPPQSKRPGWDVADAISEGWDQARIQGAIDTATVVQTVPASPAQSSSTVLQPANDPAEPVETETAAELLARIHEEFPIPALPGDGKLSYVFHDGVPWLVQDVFRTVRGQPEATRKFICTPFVPVARVTDAEGADSGKRFKVWGPNGGQSVTLWGKELAPRGLSDAIEAFVRRAGDFDYDSTEDVGRILHSVRARHRIRVYKTPGWQHVERATGHDGPPIAVFLTRSGEVICPEGEDAPVMGIEVELDTNSAIPPRWAQAGSMDDWRQAMEEIATADCMGNAEGRLPHVILGILMGFSGPLAQSLGEKTWGVVVSGDPGRGKTTGLIYAAAIWGSVHERAPNSALRTMGATLAGAEDLAAVSTGTVLCLDEAGQSRDVTKLPQLLYKLSSNQGDVRHGQASHPTTWSTLVLVSAEQPLRASVEGSGGTYASGLDRRFLDLNLAGIEKLPPEVAERITARAHSVYGLAGPAFMRFLMQHRHMLDTQLLRRSIREFAASMAPPGAPPVLQVAARQLALLKITGDYAKAAGLLPATLDTERAVAWAWACVASGTGAMSDAERGILALRSSIAVRLGGTVIDIHQTDQQRRPPVVDGWFDQGRFYIPTDVALRWAGHSLSNKGLFEALDRNGLIAERGKDGRGALRSLPNGQTLNRGTAKVSPETAAKGAGITSEDVTGASLAAEAVQMVLRATGVYALDRVALKRWVPVSERNPVEPDNTVSVDEDGVVLVG
ncbi:DUF927 domain-containing protein [Belnapia rosea]|uniref:DUF927 domain-containing protein n=1 Tax=Belnapia rosea TaxID=938405 RepID=UPI00210EDA11|nr:DUF927 domain-containing protein [Belnapia rosea]